MGYYRRIDVRMHGDERYRVLSSPIPNGKTLFEWLIHGPFSNSIGLYQAGQMAMAEALGWRSNGFAQAFAEVIKSGMVIYCPEHRMVYLPNFLKHNPPGSTNVAKGWIRLIDSLPECHLIGEWIQQFKGFAKAFPVAFKHGVPEGIGKGVGTVVRTSPSPSPSPYLSTSEPPIVPHRGTRRTSKHGKRNKLDHGNELGPPGFRAFWLAYPKKVGKQAALKEWGLEDPEPSLLTEILEAVSRQSKSDEWTKDAGQFIPHPSTWLHQRRWEDEVGKAQLSGPEYPRLNGTER